MIKIVEDFKTRYRTALVMTGIKAAEISRKTGISEATLSQYLGGYSKPKDERLALLAGVLGVDPLWLKGFDVPMNRNDITGNFLTKYTDTPGAKNLVAYYNAMNKYGQNKLLEYAEDIADKYKKGEDDATEEA